MERQQLYRALPKVDLFLDSVEGRKLIEQYGRKETVYVVREILEKMRKMIVLGEVKAELPEDVLDLFLELAKKELEEKTAPNFKRIINATGIILHTNFGRAPIAKEAAEGLADLLKGYSNLEYDLEAGTRGERYSHFESLICRLTGAEAAMAVNNNAAAVMLMLNTFAKNKEVILSRGEMIEIGGKFRIPEVMEASGCYLKEIGTTNKTHYSDYEDAINENTGAILKVHTSNYRVLGFTASVSAKELVPLKEANNLPLLEDLGSGVMVPLETFGLEHEPTVQEALASGIDVVCFSGDKLLGGPQAGIIAGKKAYINRMKKNPLTRAFRIDKCTAYLLETAFAAYLKDDYAEWIPVYRFLSRSLNELEAMAETLDRLLANEKMKDVCDWEITKKKVPIGGGSLPLEEIESCQIAVVLDRKTGVSINALAEKLRMVKVPIIGRIADEKLYLDVRCMEKSDLELTAKELGTCIRRLTCI